MTSSSFTLSPPRPALGRLALPIFSAGIKSPFYSKSRRHPAGACRIFPVLS
jgi:hypothetical protein